MTGMELKLRRIKARITGRALAAEMGITSSRISAIEREAVPTAAMQQRYTEALERLEKLTHVRNMEAVG